jgi:hypothetical protein
MKVPERTTGDPSAFDPDAAGNGAWPYPALARLREERPVHRAPSTGHHLDAGRGPKHLVVYELDDVEVLHDDWAELTTRHSELARAIYPHMTNLVPEVFVRIGAFGGGNA